MERIEKRISIRIFGQGGNIEDQDLLIDTRLIRYMNEIEKLGRHGLPMWILGALKNQFILEQNSDGNKPPMVSLPNQTKPTKNSKPTPSKPITELTPTPVPGWEVNPIATEKFRIKR